MSLNSMPSGRLSIKLIINYSVVKCLIVSTEQLLLVFVPSLALHKVTRSSEGGVRTADQPRLSSICGTQV